MRHDVWQRLNDSPSAGSSDPMLSPAELQCSDCGQNCRYWSVVLEIVVQAALLAAGLCLKPDKDTLMLLNAVVFMYAVILGICRLGVATYMLEHLLTKTVRADMKPPGIRLHSRAAPQSA